MISSNFALVLLALYLINMAFSIYKQYKTDKQIEQMMKRHAEMIDSINRRTNGRYR